MFKILIVFWTLLINLVCWGSEISKISSKIVVAISSAPNNLNPLFSTDANSQNILRLIHRGLGDFNRKMQFECDLCENYKELRGLRGEEKNESYYKIEFHLKKNQFFQNGLEITADDIVKTWEYYTRESNKSVFRHAFLKIKNIKILDKYHFILEYDNYEEDALSNLVLFKILRLEGNKIISAGDYKIEHQNDFEIHLKVMRESSLKPKDLIFKVVRDETTLALKLIHGEIDIAFNSISPRKMEWLEKNKTKKINLWEAPSGNLQYLALNHKRFPMSDLRFRKVLHQALGVHESLQFRFKNYVELSNSLFSSAFTHLYQDDIKVDLIDINKAMNDLGFTKNSNGLYMNGAKELVLEFKVSNNRNTMEVARIFKENLRKMGITVKIVSQEWGTYTHSYQSGNYEILMAGWVGFTGPSMLSFAFSSESLPPRGGNRINYKSDELDKILFDAKNVLNNDEKNELYKKASRLVAQDLAYIFLWHPKSIILARDCYRQITPYPNGNFRSILEMENQCE